MSDLEQPCGDTGPHAEHEWLERHVLRRHCPGGLGPPGRTTPNLHVEYHAPNGTVHDLTCYLVQPPSNPSKETT